MRTLAKPEQESIFSSVKKVVEEFSGVPFFNWRWVLTDVAIIAAIAYSYA